MTADVKSPADPPRAATREQKSPIGIEHSNKGLSRQQLISQSVAQFSITTAEKVSLCLSQELHGCLKKFLNRSNFRYHLVMRRSL
jgi:hypothetical protein